MFDKSPGNPQIPSFLRFTIAVECTVVLAGAVLLFFLPNVASDLWPWAIPPFNARFVGAVYFAAYIPLLLFWFNPRWTPGRFILWLIFIFTTLILVVMFIHWDAFDWNRISTYLIFWPLYIFLPVNSAIFLFRSRDVQNTNVSEPPAFWRSMLWLFTLVGAIYGLGLLFAPALFTSFWPWNVDAFHARIYASAFLTPAAGAWILSKRGAASEYLTFGLNLLSGGLLPILGALWTSATVPAERQITYDLGTWMFFAIFLTSLILGIIQLVLVFRKTK
jgi:hypothetical protein